MIEVNIMVVKGMESSCVLYLSKMIKGKLMGQQVVALLSSLQFANLASDIEIFW